MTEPTYAQLERDNLVLREQSRSQLGLEPAERDMWRERQRTADDLTRENADLRKSIVQWRGVPYV